MAKCRSCGAEVLWAVLPSGKRAPLDAEPTTIEALSKSTDIKSAGDLKENVYDFPDGYDRSYGAVNEAIMIPKEELTAATEFYRSHFRTCPDASSHSRKS